MDVENDVCQAQGRPGSRSTCNAIGRNPLSISSHVRPISIAKSPLGNYNAGSTTTRKTRNRRPPGRARSSGKVATRKFSTCRVARQRGLGGCASVAAGGAVQAPELLRRQTCQCSQGSRQYAKCEGAGSGVAAKQADVRAALRLTSEQRPDASRSGGLRRGSASTSSSSSGSSSSLQRFQAPQHRQRACAPLLAPRLQAAQHLRVPLLVPLQLRQQQRAQLARLPRSARGSGRSGCTHTPPCSSRDGSSPRAAHEGPTPAGKQRGGRSASQEAVYRSRAQGGAGRGERPTPCPSLCRRPRQRARRPRAGQLRRR